MPAGAVRAVDSFRADDVQIAAAGGSMRSGIWGEPLSTAARNRGCVGAIVDGAVRDVEKMAAMDFAIFARGRCVYDSLHRQRVIDVDVPVEIGEIRFCPGDLVIADRDGVVVVPKEAEPTGPSLAHACATALSMLVSFGVNWCRYAIGQALRVGCVVVGHGDETASHFRNVRV